MSSNRIFSSVKGTEPQGRSANLAGNMFKRAPIFNHVPAEKQQASSPFANYNCRSAESLFSDTQSSQEQRLNLDTIRQIIKEECTKMKGDEDNNKKLVLTLQAQIKDLKQKISESDAQNLQKMQDFKQTMKNDMKQQVAKMGHQVDQQISNRLRTFFQKVNVQLKKDILKIASQEFLSFSYGEDLQNRLQSIDSSLNQVNMLIKTKQISTEQLQKKINSININQTLQNKLGKIQKQADNIKKLLNQCHSRTRQLEEWKQAELSKSIESQIRQLKNKIQKIKQQQINLINPFKQFESKSSKYDSALNQLQLKIDQTQRNCEDVKGQLVQLHKKVVSQQFLKKDSESQVKKLGNENQIFQTSIIIANNSSIYNQKKKSSNESNQIAEFGNVAVSTSMQYQQAIKSIYQVDSEGYLMDGQRKYLLTQSGSMIKLDNEQIKVLIESKLVEIIDY